MYTKNLNTFSTYEKKNCFFFTTKHNFASRKKNTHTFFLLIENFD